VKTGVIILFHGSRAKGSDEAVRRIIGEVRRRGGYDVLEEAYLQHASPALGEAIESCIRQHAGKIVIVPFFMQFGAHVTKDVPPLVEKAKKQHPGIEIVVTDYVGAHPLMAKIVVDLVVGE
jgi:sirohydrochlorin ferrochelatase